MTTNTDTQFDCLMRAHQTLIQRYAELADRVESQDLQIRGLIEKNTELADYVRENEVFVRNHLNSISEKLNNVKIDYKQVINDVEDHLKRRNADVDEQINEFVKRYEDTIGSLGMRVRKHDAFIEKEKKYKTVLIGYNSVKIPIFATKDNFANKYQQEIWGNNGVLILTSVLELEIKELTIQSNLSFIDLHGKMCSTGTSTGPFSIETVKYLHDFCDKHNIKTLYCGGDDTNFRKQIYNK